MATTETLLVDGEVGRRVATEYYFREGCRTPCISPGPAARWIAPSTPPPPSSEVLAALTMASTASVVMSAWMARTKAGILEKLMPAKDREGAEPSIAVGRSKREE